MSLRINIFAEYILSLKYKYRVVTQLSLAARDASGGIVPLSCVNVTLGPVSIGFFMIFPCSDPGYCGSFLGSIPCGQEPDRQFHARSGVLMLDLEAFQKWF